jgi:hypothetical protein
LPNVEMLKMILGVTGKDELLQFALDTVIDEVKNYCNITEIPAELDNIILRMTADVWRSEGYGNESKPQTAASVSRGDVSVSFDGKSTASISGVKSVLDDYRAQLAAFRKLRW